MHATRFAALGDATRFRLVEMLSVEPLPVHVLTAAFSISRPAISRHLRVLKEAGVVIEEKSGRENLYRLQSHHLTPLTAWLAGLDSPAATADKTKKQKRPPKPKLAVAPIVLEVPIAPPPVEPPPAPEPEIKVTSDAKAKAQPKPKQKAEPIAKPAPAPSQNQMAWEF